MASVEVRVFYLEMLSAGAQPVPPLPEGMTLVHARSPSVAFYRFLYNTVGRDYHWYSRGRLSDAQLSAVLSDPGNEVHVLYSEGVPAGFAELDRRTPGEVELVQFGLMPEFIGRGLGKTFLRHIIRRAWDYEPRRFWLHTCTLDHPAALPNYLNAGFALYREQTITREIG
jgi:GNAT superfamily N-acetyltransferase